MGLLSYIFDVSRRGGPGWQCPRPLSVLGTDRRGVTAIVFAVSATVLLGVIGLATEVGTWYLARAQAYNASYAAAVAGALAASEGGDTGAAQQAALDVALSNGYSNASVTINQQSPTNPAAWEVQVTVNVAPLIARLFTSLTNIAVTASAVGAVMPVGNACALSLSGDLQITQPQVGFYNINRCYYASNATDSAAVSFSGDGLIWAWGITTPGDCQNCPQVATNPLATLPSSGPAQSVLTGGIDTSGQSYLYRPNASYQPPTSINITPSFTAIDAIAPSLPTDGSSMKCPDPSKGGISYNNTNPGLDSTTFCPSTPQDVTIPDGTTLVPTKGDGISCTQIPADTGTPCGYYNMNITIKSGSKVMVSPTVGGSHVTYGDPTSSTYLFVNSSLTLASGSTLRCVSTGTLQGSTAIVNWPCAAAPPVTGEQNPTGGAGVTIVLTGSSVGTLTIASGASVNLAAADTNTRYPALSGVLFYRNGPINGDSPGNPGVNIADDPTGLVLLNGVMYFPTSSVNYTANTNFSYPPVCATIVAGTLTLGGPGPGAGYTQLTPCPSTYPTAVVQAPRVIN